MLVERSAIGCIGRMWSNVISSTWVDSFVDMWAYTQEKLIKDPQREYIQYIHGTMSWHEGGRNQMVTKAKGEWLFQIDTDHAFSPDLLIRLLNLLDKYQIDVISATYCYKSPPHGPVAGILKPNEDGTQNLVPLEDWDNTKEIIPVDLVGGGGLLVRNSVFRRINEELREAPFNIIPGLSEDFSFCARCKKLGIQVYLAPQVEIHHEIPTLLYVGDYLAAKRGNPAIIK